MGPPFCRRVPSRGSTPAMSPGPVRPHPRTSATLCPVGEEPPDAQWSAVGGLGSVRTPCSPELSEVSDVARSARRPRRAVRDDRREEELDVADALGHLHPERRRCRRRWSCRTRATRTGATNAPASAFGAVRRRSSIARERGVPRRKSPPPRSVARLAEIQERSIEAVRPRPTAMAPPSRAIPWKIVSRLSARVALRTRTRPPVPTGPPLSSVRWRSVTSAVTSNTRSPGRMRPGTCRSRRCPRSSPGRLRSMSPASGPGPVRSRAKKPGREPHRPAGVHRAHRVAERAVTVRAAPVEGVFERVDREGGGGERDRLETEQREYRDEREQRDADAAHRRTLPIIGEAGPSVGRCLSVHPT